MNRREALTGLGGGLVLAIIRGVVCGFSESDLFDFLLIVFAGVGLVAGPFHIYFALLSDTLDNVLDWPQRVSFALGGGVVLIASLKGLRSLMGCVFEHI